MSSKDLPLTIQAINSTTNLPNKIVVGENGTTLNLSLDITLQNTYWFVLIDRKTLKVVLNVHTTDNTSVPSQLTPFLGNTGYILIVSTQNLGSAYLPQGKLYEFLLSEGAGSQLRTLEQIYETLNCGNWGFMAYSLVAILGDDGCQAFEDSTYNESAILHNLQLHPIDVGGVNYYTPVSV